MTPCDKFGQVVTADFAKASEACAEVIRKSWAAINSVTANGKFISVKNHYVSYHHFGICSKIYDYWHVSDVNERCSE